MNSASAILTNKTFWANLLAPLFAWLATKYGFQLSAETQGEIIVLVMVIVNLAVEHFTGPGLGTKTAATNILTPTNPPKGN